MERKRKWKRKHESGREIGVEEFAYLSPRRRTPNPAPSTYPLSPSNPKPNWHFWPWKWKYVRVVICSDSSSVALFLARLRNMLAVRVCVCVCGFVKSASVISVRLNGAKQTWAKNSDRKRPQRGPKKCSSWTCFMWVLCRAKERQKERVGTRDKAIYIFAVRECEREGEILPNCIWIGFSRDFSSCNCLVW